MRAAHSSTLKVGAIEIPVKVYVAANPYEFGGHLYHMDCNERIQQPRWCPEHGFGEEDDPIVAYSAIEVAGKLVSVPDSIRDSLLGRKDPITIISAIPQKELATMMMHGTFPVGAYYMEPEGIGEIKSPNLAAFKALLLKLGQRNRMLLVTLGVGGLKRYAVLLPSGMLYTLNYKEELRERFYWDADPATDLRSYMLDFVDKKSDESVGKFSLKRISNAVDKWLESLTPAPRRGRKKSTETTTRKVEANA